MTHDRADDVPTDGSGPDGVSIDDPTARLVDAPFEVVGRFADASNATLLVRLTDRDPRPLDQLASALGRDPTIDDLDPADLAVYKPRRGERPLWDFPSGTLHRREVAAFEVSRALGWDLVPTTVLRTDAPFGVGSLQRFVVHDPEDHYFTLLEDAVPEVIEQLRTMVVFDLVIDNADRKGGHVLLEPAPGDGPGRVQVIDHGVTFSAEPKLRTVAWDFVDDPIPGRLLADVDRLREALAGDLGARLEQLLHPVEVAVLADRVAAVVATETYPAPAGEHPYPWPLL